MIIQKKTLKNVLFLDIETATITHNFSELPTSLQKQWWHKSKQLLSDPEININSKKVSELYTSRAGIYAEFSKVICISVGYLRFSKNAPPILRVKSFHGEEKKLLSLFTAMLDEHFNEVTKNYICGHNIREFDIPFICRRCVIHGIPLPTILSLSGKKPWQVSHLLDTMNLWKFGDYKHYTSLDLLAAVLGIPSPKEEMDGSMVGSIYWDQNGIEKIISYCENDVLTTAQVLMKFAGQELIKDDCVEVIDQSEKQQQLV